MEHHLYLEPPSAEPRRSLKRAGLLACGMPSSAEDQLRPKMSPTMEVGPDPGPAAAEAAAGERWWVHAGLALAGWCVHEAPVAGLGGGVGGRARSFQKRRPARGRPEHGGDPAAGQVGRRWESRRSTGGWRTATR